MTPKMDMKDEYIYQFDSAIKYVTKGLKKIGKGKKGNLFETVVLFFILTDLAIVKSKKNRQISQQILLHIDEKYNIKKKVHIDILSQRFKDTQMLYGQIIRGKEAMGLWWHGKKGDMKRTGLEGCMFVFGDLLFGYSAKDYFNNKPVMLLDIFLEFEMVSVMSSTIFPYMVSYFNKIYSL